MLMMDGVAKDSSKDIWIPLEKVATGELRIQLETTNVEQPEKSSSGLIELVLIEARDLIAADIRGTSDPFVKVQYGNTKKKTKVLFQFQSYKLMNLICVFPKFEYLDTEFYAGDL